MSAFCYTNFLPFLPFSVLSTSCPLGPPFSSQSITHPCLLYFLLSLVPLSNVLYSFSTLFFICSPWPFHNLISSSSSKLNFLNRFPLFPYLLPILHPVWSSLELVLPVLFLILFDCSALDTADSS